MTNLDKSQGRLRQPFRRMIYVFIYFHTKKHREKKGLHTHRQDRGRTIDKIRFASWDDVSINIYLFTRYKYT